MIITQKYLFIILKSCSSSKVFCKFTQIPAGKYSVSLIFVGKPFCFSPLRQASQLVNKRTKAVKLSLKPKSRNDTKTQNPTKT
jgi:hypothetical protein